MRCIEYPNEKAAKEHLAIITGRLFRGEQAGKIPTGHEARFQQIWKGKPRPVTWTIRAGFPSLYAIYRGCIPSFTKRLLEDHAVKPDYYGETFTIEGEVPKMPSVKTQPAVKPEAKKSDYQERVEKVKNGQLPITELIPKNDEEKAEVEAEGRRVKAKGRKTRAKTKEVPVEELAPKVNKRKSKTVNPVAPESNWNPETSDRNEARWFSTFGLFEGYEPKEPRQFMIGFQEGHIAGIVDWVTWADNSKTFECRFLDHDLSVVLSESFDNFTAAREWMLSQPFDRILAA